MLCVDGVEISTTGGHYIGLGMAPAPYRLAGEPRDVVEDVARLGGFGIVAHPGSPKPDLRWREWAAAFDALEWLNADSEWRDEPPLAFARLILQYPFRPSETLASLLDRPDAVLDRWDALTRRRRIVGLAGTDAHARIGGREFTDPDESPAGLRLPSYEALFKAFSIRVRPGRPWTGQAGPDASDLLRAIRSGHLHSSIDALARSRGFSFTAASGRSFATEGDDLAVEGPVRLRVLADTPSDASIALFRNGRVVQTVQGGELAFTDSGAGLVFRAEVHLNRAPGRPPVPWIVSNPIYLRRPGASAELPLTRTQPRAKIPADIAGMHIEHDSSSAATITRRDRGLVPGLNVSYRLGGGARAGQFAAAVLPIDFRTAQFDRLSFEGRADRPTRVSIQVRLDGAGERWQRSIYLDGTTGPISVFFSDMTPVGRVAMSASRPPMDRVQSLLLVIDTNNTLPGRSGTIDIADLRFER